MLTNVPRRASGPGNYIAVGGGGAVGHYAVAHTVDAGGIAPPKISTSSSPPRRKIRSRTCSTASRSRTTRTSSTSSTSSTSASGQWMSLCPYNARPRARRRWRSPEDRGRPNKFIFACTATGVASKCARNWGYKPWARPGLGVRQNADGGWALAPETFPLKPYYDICTAPRPPGYCQDGRSYTKNGTLVDLFDTRQIIWPNAIENPFSASNADSQWMMAQEYFISHGSEPTNRRAQGLGAAADALQRAVARRRVRATSRTSIASSTITSRTAAGRARSPTRPASRCSRRPTARTTSTKTATRCPGTAALHDEGLQDDAGVLRRGRRRPGWTAACTAQATTVCQTGGVPVAEAARCGRAIVTSDAQSIYPKYLFGPQGAVLRVDGSAEPSSAATVSGWACDPEWPGATVAVRIYGGAPRDGRTSARRSAGRPGAGDAARARGERGLRRARTAPTPATGFRSRCPRIRPATSSSTRSTRRRPTGRRRRRR